MRRPLRIGLTGGIASGKSTVADLFARMGVPIIDTDVIARQVVQLGKPALDEIRAAFGDDVFDAHGQLDRASMRRIIFSDADQREQLESILHPRIRDETISQVIAAGGPYQIIVVPLLVGSPMLDVIDRVLVVDCDEDTQLARLMERDVETVSQARRILAAQSSREDRLRIADDVIPNDQDIAETRSQVDDLHDRYLMLIDGQS